MKSPKPLTTNKPVKLIFVGGFLGSGKPTALGAVACDIIHKGMRVGIVTNDQSANLADTVIVQQMLEELGVPIQEVVAGCFRDKFKESPTTFPEEVAYLFGRQLKEADLIVLNKIDRSTDAENVNADILDLQCFSPAYPNPPYLVREGAIS